MQKNSWYARTIRKGNLVQKNGWYAGPSATKKVPATKKGDRDMTGFLYSIVAWVARIHNLILSWNDGRSVPFTDKELHFIVIGLLGMVMIFIVYPIFKWLAERDHTMVIAWIYVFTLIIVISFAIEIGQGYTGTGNMEFADIMFGVVGFFIMFAIFAIFRAIWHSICRWWRSRKRKKH